MPALFQIGNDLLAVNELIEDKDGDFSDPEIAKALTDYLAAVADQEAEKIGSYVALIKHLEMEAAAAEAEMRYFQAKANARKARIDWLKTNLKAHMEKTGRLSVRAANGWVVAIQKNGGKKLLVIRDGVDVGDVNPMFVKTVKMFDKEAMREFLEAAGGEPAAEGARGAFWLGEPGTHVRIK